MIFSSMEYPGKDYRVQVVDTWLGEEFEPMDNPKNGDKIVYRTIGENGQPVEQKTEVYQNGAWVEQGGGGGSDLTVCSGTFINNSNTPYDVYLCHADDTQEGSVASVQSLPSDTRTIDVILFKGAAIGSVLMGPETAEVQGDAEYSDGDLFVTGDFTITFN